MRLIYSLVIQCMDGLVHDQYGIIVLLVSLVFFFFMSIIWRITIINPQTLGKLQGTRLNQKTLGWLNNRKVVVAAAVVTDKSIGQRRWYA